MKLFGYWRSSAAYRVRIALNLKGLSAEHISVHLVKNGGEQHSPEYAELNPQHLVPTLIDSNEIGEFSLSQSMAIIEYLDEKHPHIALLPANLEDKAIVRAMAQSIACEVHPLNNLRVLQYLVDEMGLDEAAKLKWYHHWIEQGFAAYELLLTRYSGRYSFGDNVSLADLCLVPQVYNAKRFNVPLEAYPELMRVFNECEKLEAFKQAAPEAQSDAS
ncbi:maleylacetoacetate isomerase [Shewanella sp. SR44-3]|uniref:maleylacetoacetate isomerase n=1 Tax=unclassified Shewanella TaxID=196818 RepID=UPI0015FE11BC|nr:maleylacetoacetate isomerase [Shewanella sp. SR44-3]MBB1270648.1 maleylacetoacetate isomerase [Shewanella sp. SR44-3]